MSQSPSLADGVPIDVQRLIETRLLIQANSGGGKSYAIRRLLEQTYGHVQHLVLDVEGEFHTLRERFDYVLAGKGGDCPAEVKSAALLARRLLELGVSAIVDLYELGAARELFVARFLGALIAAPRELWRPLLVVVDEAHLFAPQRERQRQTADERRSKEPTSSEAVIDLMTRGRKRGFCGVLATQRISKLSKDAAAECNCKLIGRTALDVDQRRAAEELGIAGADERRALRALAPGQFHAFGPAISDEVRLIRVGPVQTTHPKAGARGAAPTPPRAKVRAVLAQLADLPAEAAAEERTVAELRERVRELERHLAAGPATKFVEKPIPVVDPDAVARLERLTAALLASQDKLAQAQQAVVSEADNLRTEIRRASALPAQTPPAARRSDAELAPIGSVRGLAPRHARRDLAAAQPGETPAAWAERTGELGGAELRVLEACAWMEAIGHSEADATAVAFLAGYTVNGHFSNTKGKLRAAGLVEYPSGGTIRLTDAGRAAAPKVERPTTLATLHGAVVARLDGAMVRILRPLLDVWPRPLPTDQLAATAGYTVNGHFSNMRGRLRSLGLVEYPEPNQTRAADRLFPEALR